MRYPLFLLGTSGSFRKFKSFLFIYFFFNLILNFFNLCIRSLQIHSNAEAKQKSIASFGDKRSLIHLKTETIKQKKKNELKLGKGS